MSERSTALAVQSPASDFNRRAYIVGGTDGSVLSALVCIENTYREATFVARVLNQSAEMMFGSIYGETSRGLESLRPNEFRIPAHGLDDITIVAPRRLFRRLRRVVVTMRGTTLEYSMDAAVPRWSPPLALRMAMAVVPLAVLTVILGLGRIDVGDVPATVPVRTLVQIPYTAFGAGTLSYDVRDATQHVISAGRLPLGHGTIAFQSGIGSASYRATLRFRQFFGERLRVAGPIAVTTPVPAPLPPEIRAFEVASTQVRAGDPIEVRYSLSASGGSLRVVDVAGIVLASAALDPHGRTSIPAPAVTTPTPVRVDLRATRAGRETHTSATVLLLPRENSAAIEAGRPLEAGDVVRLPVPFGIAGRGLIVEMLEHQFPLHLTLQDSTGRVIAKLDPALDASDAVLDVPTSAAGNYVLVVTIDANGGQQSVILPVPVRPQ